MGRIENVTIFEDTRHCYETEPELVAAIKRSDGAQKVIAQEDRYGVARPHYEEPAKIILSRKRSLEAAWAYRDRNVCVLNFASATNPGGGVERGSSAQEECLCRCSTLYANLTSQKLWSQFYGPHRRQRNPLYNDDCIYTPGVVVFKSDTELPELLPAAQWWKTNVISCAAPNLRPSRDGTVRITIEDDELRQLHVRRMRRILDIAASEGNDVMILGAYGCGAFLNPPQIVAEAMKQVVQENRHCFRVIEFAVYCPPGNDRNYRIFRRVFEKAAT